MKRIIAFVLSLFICTDVLYGQSLNPYEQFGYTPRHQFVMTKAPKGITLTNPNTNSNVAKLVLGLKNRQIYFFDEHDSLLNTIAVPEEMFARFISVDPLTAEYPHYTPYQFAGNKPIWAFDLDGAEEYYSNSGTYLGHGKDKENNELRLATKYEPLKDAQGDVVKGRYLVFDFKKITIKNAGANLKKLFTDAKTAGGKHGKERSGFFILDVANAELYFHRNLKREAENETDFSYEDPTQTVNGVTTLYGQPNKLVLGQIHTHQAEDRYLGKTVLVTVAGKEVKMKWGNRASFYTQYRTPSSDGNVAVSNKMNMFVIGFNTYYFSRNGVGDSNFNLSPNTDVFNDKFNILKYALERNAGKIKTP